MRNLDRPTAVSLSKRAGLMLVAIGLAILFVLVALNGTGNSYLGTSTPQTFPAQSFFSPQCCIGSNYVTPQQIVAINMSSGSGQLIVYFIKANATDFSTWLAQDGAPNSGSLYQVQGINYLNDYLRSHSDQILGNQTIPPNSNRLVTFKPADVELVVVIIANPGAATQYTQTNVVTLSVRVPTDAVTIEVSAFFLIVGGALAGLGFIMGRRRYSKENGSKSSTSVGASF